MYAVIATGGKQHRVSEGDIIRVEKLEASAGDTINFDKVLAVKDGSECSVGSPYLENRTVTAEVLADGKGKKVSILKFRRRKHYMRRYGHRQQYTEVKITKIT